MSQRSEQVGEELRKIVSKIFIEDMIDPRLGFVTITRAEVTPDLRFARIFYSVLGDEKQKESTAEAIAENMKDIRRTVVERINMKFAMDLRFELDPSIEESFKLDKIFKKLKDEEKPK